MAGKKTETEVAAADGFTDKERLFIAKYTEYGAKSFLNGAEAARSAGYSKRSAKVIASQNLTKLNLRAEIDRRLQEFALGPGEVLARLGEHAANVAGTYVKVGKDKKPVIDVAAMVRDGKQHLIKGITYTRSGQVVVETYDAQAALVHLGRYHKLFVDRMRTETWEDDLVDLIRGNKATLDDVKREFGDEIAARLAARLGISTSQG